MSSSADAKFSRAVITAAEPQLFVAGIKASCDFFVKTLGFTIVFTYGEPPFYAQVARDGGRLNLRCVASAEEIELLFLEFQAAGATFFQTLKREPWGASDFIVRDPNGNLLLFAGPAE
jgi:catechol 2,3-dioxygenase-like lactoylglutathione lyase family enzyme